MSAKFLLNQSRLCREMLYNTYSIHLLSIIEWGDTICTQSNSALCDFYIFFYRSTMYSAPIGKWFIFRFSMRLMNLICSVVQYAEAKITDLNIIKLTIFASAYCTVCVRKSTVKNLNPYPLLQFKMSVYEKVR